MPANRIERVRAAWTHRAQRRPDFAIAPGPGPGPGAGQQSVWDYPRPPADVPDQRLVEIHAGQQRLARSDQSTRALDTGSPPAFHLPPEDFDADRLRPPDHRTFREWKGRARYFHVETDEGLVADAVRC